MTADDTLLCRIAFARYRNICIDTASRFEAAGVSPVDFFSKPAQTLASTTKIKSEYFDDRRRDEALSQARQELAFISSTGVTPLYYTDEVFPQRMRECGDAPVMLYALGDTSAIHSRHSVAIVGTRHCTAYGADFTARLVADLAEAVDSLTIISGLAYGIDIKAHRAAMEAGVPTGAILAHGLNTIYPADHRNDARQIVRDGGFLATEYTSGGVIHRGNFLARNRLIAALADVTVVVESDIKGGAMSTARMASAYNREVMALPGRVNDTYSRGCNALLAGNTASVIRDADDLLAITGWERRPTEGKQQTMVLEMPEEYTPVIDILRQQPDATVNDLCVALSMPYARLSALLFRMEIDDYIVSVPGGRYALPAKSR